MHEPVMHRPYLLSELAAYRCRAPSPLPDIALQPAVKTPRRVRIEENAVVVKVSQLAWLPGPQPVDND